MIIITGASRGVGRYLLEKYIGLGQQVLGTYNTTKPELHAASYRKVNTCDPEEISQLSRLVSDSENPLTLINCAGINKNGLSHEIDLASWRDVIDTNLVGTFNMIRAFLPIMRAHGGGRIINFSSVVVLRATPGVSAYAASKSALSGLSKSVMAENARYNITINNVTLGYSSLGMINQVPDKYLENIKSQIPNGRLCEPEEIFRTIEFIRATEYLNGTSINLTGGLE